MTDADRIHTGRCLCGAIRLEAQGEPLWCGHCHCESCRRNTGGPVATFVGWAVGDYRYTDGSPRVYASSPGVKRTFCGDCGNPLTYEGERFPGEVHAYISVFDDPSVFTPTFHVFMANAIPWFHIADDLPRYAATTKDGPPLG